MSERKILITVTAVLLGFFITTQNRSFQILSKLISRDNNSNVFQEIKILKDKNKDLEDEVDELNSTIEQLADRNLALFAIQQEIEKYQKLSGESSVFGKGIIVTIDGNITVPWIVDIINELFAVGAEAVMVNNIRITNPIGGFDSSPLGKVFIHGNVLSRPYVFGAIGDPQTMIEVLELPGGIFDRLEASMPNIKITTEEKEIVQMD